MYYPYVVSIVGKKRGKATYYYLVESARVANGKAPIAQRGKAKQKRSDLRLVGLGLVVTQDGGIPLTWHAYPGSKPGVTQIPGHDHPAARPVPGGVRRGRHQRRRRRHDGGLRRRAELRSELHAPGRQRATLHRVCPGQ